MEAEIWNPILGYEGLYEASSLGQIRSLMFKGAPRKRPRIIVGKIDRRGYRQVLLYKPDGPRRMISVHRLVLLAFHGDPGPKMCGCHKDGNPANNRLSNLRWDTYKGNTADALEAGFHGRTKLWNDAVRVIRAEPFYPGVEADLSRIFGVSASQIVRVRNGRMWGHVKQWV